MAVLRFVRPLDRYVFAEFWKIFVVTALGFPVLVVVIDLTDNLPKYLNRGLSRSDVALSYFYWLPDSMFLILPAAVLFATVFSIGAFTRHAEITAAKASGISFYRLIFPVYAGALLAAGFGLLLGEVVPITNAKRLELLQENRYKQGSERYNFAYAADEGRVYKVGSLNVVRGVMEGIEVERKGMGKDYPTLVMSAANGVWDRRYGWTIRRGALHVVPDSGPDLSIAFDSLHDHAMHEQPAELMAVPRSPQEMGYRDLSRFIHSLERSGGGREHPQGGARAQDRDPGHLPHHRPLRRPPGDQHPAWRRRLRGRREPRHDGSLPDADPAHEGDRGQGADPARHRGVDPECGVRHRRGVSADPRPNVNASIPQCRVPGVDRARSLVVPGTRNLARGTGPAAPSSSPP